jgi:uncharacterized membrane protein YbhN (UPF0104 family)
VGKYRRHIEFAALLLLAAALLWWFGRRLDWNLVRAALRSSDWRLIVLGALAIVLGYLWRAFRWRAFLAPLGKASLREVWVATVVGFGAILLVGRAGEVVRPVVLLMRDRNVKPAAAFVTILIERLYDSLMVVFAFSVSLALLSLPVGSDFLHVRQAGWVLVALAITAVVLLVWFRLKSRQFSAWLERVFDRWPRFPLKVRQAVISLVDQLARALSVLANARSLAITLAWTAMLWGSVVTANLLVFRAFDLRIDGRPLGLTHALFILGWSMVGSAVPTPGGAAGAFHAATGAGLVLLGVAKEQAAAVAIVLHLVDFGPAAVCGLFYFLRGDINFARLRELIKPEAVEHAVEEDLIGPDAAVRSKELRTMPAKDSV